MEKLKYCSCGNMSEPHNFKHQYKHQFTAIKQTTKKGENTFVLNAEEFKLKTGESKCTVPQCSAHFCLHGQIIKHEYQPSEPYQYREIIFNLPINTKCFHSGCGKTAEQHKENSHKFCTKIKIKNKQPQDEVKILCGKIPILNY